MSPLHVITHRLPPLIMSSPAPPSSVSSPAPPISMSLPAAPSGAPLAPAARSPYSMSSPSPPYSLSLLPPPDQRVNPAHALEDVGIAHHRSASLSGKSRSGSRYCPACRLQRRWFPDCPRLHRRTFFRYTEGTPVLSQHVVLSVGRGHHLRRINTNGIGRQYLSPPAITVLF